MFKLNQETIAIVTVGLALAGLDVTSDNSIREVIRAVRAEARADREAWQAEAQSLRAEARADREAWQTEAQSLRAEASAEREALRTEARAASCTSLRTSCPSMARSLATRMASLAGISVGSA